jgi:hypothetical protein
MKFRFVFWVVLPCKILSTDVSEVMTHRPDDGGWATGVRSPAGAKDFSSNLCAHTGSATHPASCPMGTGGKALLVRDAYHSPPSSAEVMNE